MRAFLLLFVLFRPFFAVVIQGWDLEKVYRFIDELKQFKYAVCIGASASRPTMYLQATLNMLAEGLIPPRQIVIYFDKDTYPYNDPPLIVPNPLKGRVKFVVPSLAGYSGRGLTIKPLTYIRPTLFQISCMEMFSGPEHDYPVITMEDDLLVSRDLGIYLSAFFRSWRLAHGPNAVVFYHLYYAAFIHGKRYYEDTFTHWYKRRERGDFYQRRRQLIRQPQYFDPFYNCSSEGSWATELPYTWGTQALTFSHPELRANLSKCIQEICFQRGTLCSDMAIHWCFNTEEGKRKYTPRAAVRHPVNSLVQHVGFMSATFRSSNYVNLRWHFSEDFVDDAYLENSCYYMVRTARTLEASSRSRGRRMADLPPVKLDGREEQFLGPWGLRRDPRLTTKMLKEQPLVDPELAVLGQKDGDVLKMTDDYLLEKAQCAAGFC